MYELTISRTIITKLSVIASSEQNAIEVAKDFSIMNTNSNHYDSDDKVTIKIIKVRNVD